MLASTPGEELFHGSHVTLRPAADEDLPRLAEILQEPEVARHWGAYDIDRLRSELRDPDVYAFAVEVEGTVIGMIQFSEETDPDYRHASIDIFLDPSRHGRGLGTDSVRTLARYLFAERGHHRLTIDPAADNTPAINCYRRVGFRTVGIMRNYERGPDGMWHDGLLMELLSEELNPGGDQA